MEWTSSIRLTVTTLTDCHLDDIECGKYPLVFASAENVLVKPFLDEKTKKTKKNSHTVSPEYAGLHQTKLWRVTFECSRLLFPSFVYDKIEGKLSNRLTAATLKDLRLENVVCSKYQLIFVSAEEVLSKPFLSWLKKKLPYRFTHRLYMRLFLSGDFNCSRELSWINRKG